LATAARSWRGTCQMPSVWPAVGDHPGMVPIPRARWARLAAGLPRPMTQLQRSASNAVRVS